MSLTSDSIKSRNLIGASSAPLFFNALHQNVFQQTTKAFLVFLFLLSFFNSATAQTQKEDGTWWDNNLEFKVLYEDMDSTGELMICIAQIKEQKCVENLTTGYQVKIYDANNKEIWNSLWTGKNLDIKFKKNFPKAAYLTIEANKNYVVNKMTSTRIYQDKALFLKHNLK